jgi:hypothetical protein
MKIAVRGFGDGKLLFEEQVDTEMDGFDAIVLGQLKRVLAFERNMIEIEFLDDPDDPVRFCRFGSDPRGMVMPIRVPFPK